MNVYCILKLFSDLIDNSWNNRTIREYQAIPENSTDFFDILIKNVKVNFSERLELIDLGIIIKQELESGVLKDYYQILDIGDLSFKHGLEVLDAFEEEYVHHGFELNSLLELKLSSLNEFFIKGIRQ